MEQVNFNATDGVLLNGLLYKSNTNTKTVIVSVHGMGSNCFKNREIAIANKSNENGIDYFCFNNRGSELARYLKKTINGKTEKILAGTGYEDALDGYFDVKGAILKVIELGYENILVLLSLVDIIAITRSYIGNKLDEYVEFASKKEMDGHLKYLMPAESFIHPISVRTYLRYFRDYKQIDIDDYNMVSCIDIPVFMRWGTDNEMVVHEPEELIKLVSGKIHHNNKDINCIYGANHSYL